MNKKKPPSPIIILLFVVVAFTNCYRRPDIAKTFDDIRKKTQPGLDSTINALAARRFFFDSIKMLIKTNKLKEATAVIDSLIVFDPKEEYYLVLKGDVYYMAGKYDSALYEYNMSMSIQTFPISLDARAKTYIKIDKYDSAINDYKNAAEINYYYNIKLAQVFELKKQKDSALKYYKIYLERDPASEAIHQKILALQK